MTTDVITSYTFDPVFNRVLTKTDPENNTTTYTYDTSGNLLTTTMNANDGSGPHVITNTYTTHTVPSGTVLRGLLTSVEDPKHRLTQFGGFDQWGNATLTSDALGNTSTNTFDARGRVTHATDSIGRSASNTYDELDRVLTTTRLAGSQPAAGRPSADRITQSTYRPGGQRETSTDGEGHVTHYTYDALNRLSHEEIEVTDADGATTMLSASFTYDGNGNRLTATDRRGLVRTMLYDVLNRLRSVTVDGSQVVSGFSYDRVGNKVTETDLHGHTTTYVHDALYRVVETTLPLAPYRLRATYDLVGNILESYDANGGRIAKTYDGEYRVRTETDQLGVTTTFTYDAVGNRVGAVNSSNGLTIALTHDAINRPLTVTTTFTDPVTGQPVTIPTSRTYDDAAHTIQITDGRGSVLLERYNGHDAVIESTVDPAGLALRTTHRYDGNGSLTDTVDPLNGDVDMLKAFDALGRVISTTQPLRGTSKTFYDGNNNVARTVDARGVAHRFVYDALDRKVEQILEESISRGGADLTLSRTEYVDGANLTRTFDAAGGRTEIQNDALHREVLITDPADHATVREWDGIERRAETDRRGFRTEYDYDAIGRLTARRDLGGPVASSVTSVYNSATGTRTDTDRRGIQTLTTVDPIGRLRRVARRHPSLAAEYGADTISIDEQAYDGAGLVTDHRDARGAVRHNVYDPAGRLASTTVGFGTADASTTVFTSDAAGNVLTVKDARNHGGAFDIRYTYDAANRRVTETNGAGNTTVFDFDAADQVIRITQPLGAQFVTNYAYDELGELLSIDETRGGTGGITRNVYDERRHKIAVRDAAGRLTTYRYDLLGRLTDEFRHPAAAALPTGRDGDLGPGAVNDARHTHYEYNVVGNQTLIVDPAGQRVMKNYDFLGRLDSKIYTDHAPGPDGAAVYPQPLRTSTNMTVAVIRCASLKPSAYRTAAGT